jgi:hypothetical protein
MRKNRFRPFALLVAFILIFGLILAACHRFANHDGTTLDPG